MTVETREHRLKRLKIRSMRRGIREMDLALTAFAEARLADMTDAELDLYESLLQQPDHDIFQWLCGRGDIPPQFAGLLSEIVEILQDVARPQN